MSILINSFEINRHFFQNFPIEYVFFCNLTDSNPASNIDEIQQNLFVFCIFIQILFCKIDEEIKSLMMFIFFFIKIVDSWQISVDSVEDKIF